MVKTTSARWRVFALTAFLSSLVLPVSPSLGQTAQLPPIQPARPGTPFPSMTDLQAINVSAAPGESHLAPFNLDAAMAGKVVVLMYWMVGDSNSEEILQEVAAWAAGQDGLALIGIVPPRGKTAGEVAERLQAMSLDIPCIWDVSYRVQQTVRAPTVPHSTVVDSGRIVRMLGAYNLQHRVLGDITLEKYLATAVSGGGAPTITQLPRHYPVTELIDGPFIDFTLNQVPKGERVRFSDHVKDGQYTLLVFWSPDCSHCKVELPILNDYYEKHRGSLALIGIVKVRDQGIRQRTADFIKAHDIDWPTVDDTGARIFQGYKVRTTPTTVVVNPHGIVEAVLIGSNVNLEQELGPLLGKLENPDVAVGLPVAGN
ncbi:MAG: TlpA family protein disulfide reductase [Acidobacteria bacterium]|nr:TlpA family protein disulfide reductase [Acidobacteriota bacterium]